jgi:hypothetical protein
MPAITTKTIVTTTRATAAGMTMADMSASGKRRFPE